MNWARVRSDSHCVTSYSDVVGSIRMKVGYEERHTPGFVYRSLILSISGDFHKVFPDDSIVEMRWRRIPGDESIIRHDFHNCDVLRTLTGDCTK